MSYELLARLESNLHIFSVNFITIKFFIPISLSSLELKEVCTSEQSFVIWDLETKKTNNYFYFKSAINDKKNYS